MSYSNSGRNATPDPSPSSPNKWVGPAFDPASIITFSSAGSHKSWDWASKTMTAGQLLAILTAIKAGRKAEGSVWAPATFNGGRRSAAAALGTFIMPFDSDSGTPFADVVAACDMTGWHMVVIPSSSWGSTVSEINGDAYDVWVKEQRGADTSIERYLIEILQKTPAVAAGATIIASFDLSEQAKDGRRTLRKILRVEHQPCEKYRILAFLSERHDLSTTAGRRAWKRYYDAACDVLGLPLDRTVGSVERLLFQSRLPAKLIDQAKAHVRTIEGGTINLAGLPEPKPRQRTRRGPSAFRDEKVHGRGADDEVLEYHWIDPVTGADIDLRKWAVGMKALQLADILRDGDWPLDDRGEVDGKLHIVCPFAGQHTSLAGGGTYVSNASDFERSGMVDRQRAAVIHCSHHSCQGRDRLEFITEFLRAGVLTTAHLHAARDAARAAELAADFEPIEEGTGIKPLIKPSFDWDRPTIEASLPQLKRLASEAPETFATFRQGWDIADILSADELDRLVDLAANDDIPIKDDRTAGQTRGVPQWHRLGKGFDPNDLPDRDWTLGQRFLRKAVTAGIGAPGVGKSNFALLSAISIATGRPLTGETVHRQGRVWIHNNEDDLDEQKRRIAGICRQYNIAHDLLDENLVFSSGEVQKLVLAIMEKGAVKDAFAIDELIQEIKNLGVVHMVLDPLVSLHTGVEENANAAMENVVSVIRRIANQAAVSIDLLHHISKDNSGDSEKRAGDMNAARGATSLIGAVRCAYTLTRMNKATTPEKFNISADQAGQYVRLDMAKGNYSRHEGKPRWFKIQSVNVWDDASDLTPLVSGAGEPLEDEEGPPLSPLTVGVHELWVPPPDRQAVEAPARVVREDKKHGLLQLVAEAMPKDRCNVSDVLEAVKKQRGVQATAARILVKKAVLETDAGHAIQLGDRSCTLRIVREGHAKNGPLFLERDWLELENDD
jgi:hypothetical protein